MAQKSSASVRFGVTVLVDAIEPWQRRPIMRDHETPYPR
jgi:hypothetical protein